MTVVCNSPSGRCDQTNCTVTGRCAWPASDPWAGQFGDEYYARNRELVPAAIALFRRALTKTLGLRTVIEFGAGAGQNLLAIRHLFPKVQCTAVEINPTAADEIPSELTAVRKSIFDFFIEHGLVDLVLTRGLLIHIPPDRLADAYAKIYSCSRRYILVCEYYNPAPVMIPYRGQDNMLWKRDFAGELLTLYPDLQVLDYGFVWRRDPNWPQDDVTWFLLEKRA